MHPKHFGHHIGNLSTNAKYVQNYFRKNIRYILTNAKYTYAKYFQQIPEICKPILSTSKKNSHSIGYL